MVTRLSDIIGSLLGCLKFNISFSRLIEGLHLIRNPLPHFVNDAIPRRLEIAAVIRRTWLLLPVIP